GLQRICSKFTNCKSHFESEIRSGAKERGDTPGKAFRTDTGSPGVRGGLGSDKELESLQGKIGLAID
ncbi:hypothetical protein NPIL_395951, partial [Nephila pilipes]